MARVQIDTDARTNPFANASQKYMNREQLTQIPLQNLEKAYVSTERETVHRRESSTND